MRILAMHPNYSKPQFSGDVEGAYDIFMPDIGVLSANVIKTIPLGFSLEVPEGFVAVVTAKHLYASKYGLEIAGGLSIIGAGYYDEWKMPLRAKSQLSWDADESLLQFTLVPIHTEFIEEVLSWD